MVVIKMSGFSLTAQAVLDAICDQTEPDCDTQHLIAAAFRAAALYCKRDTLLLLSLADELEAQ